MRDWFYADRRDIVKWGAIVFLARENDIHVVVQVAMYRPELLKWKLSIRETAALYVRTRGADETWAGDPASAATGWVARREINPAAHRYRSGPPVSISYISRYRCAVFSTMAGGSAGPGAVLSHSRVFR